MTPDPPASRIALSRDKFWTALYSERYVIAEAYPYTIRSRTVLEVWKLQFEARYFSEIKMTICGSCNPNPPSSVNVSAVRSEASMRVQENRGIGSGEMREVDHQLRRESAPEVLIRIGRQSRATAPVARLYLNENS